MKSKKMIIIAALITFVVLVFTFFLKSFLDVKRTGTHPPSEFLQK